MKIILGSSSKWRRNVVQELFKTTVECISPDIDEKSIRNDDAEKLVLMISHAKADAIIEKLKDLNEDALIITGDQVIRYKNEIREKPKDVEEAKEFLTSYSKSPAETVSGIVVTHLKSGKRAEGIDVARIFFKEIPKDSLNDLVKNEDIMKCCGAVVIEVLHPFITKIEGTEDSIFGMPKELTKKLIRELNVNLEDL